MADAIFDEMLRDMPTITLEEFLDCDEMYAQLEQSMNEMIGTMELQTQAGLQSCAEMNLPVHHVAIKCTVSHAQNMHFQPLVPHLHSASICTRNTSGKQTHFDPGTGDRIINHVDAKNIARKHNNRVSAKISRDRKHLFMHKTVNAFCDLLKMVEPTMAVLKILQENNVHTGITGSHERNFLKSWIDAWEEYNRNFHPGTDTVFMTELYTLQERWKQEKFSKRTRENECTGQPVATGERVHEKYNSRQKRICTAADKSPK